MVDDDSTTPPPLPADDDTPTADDATTGGGTADATATTDGAADVTATKDDPTDTKNNGSCNEPPTKAEEEALESKTVAEAPSSEPAAVDGTATKPSDAGAAETKPAEDDKVEAEPKDNNDETPAEKHTKGRKGRKPKSTDNAETATPSDDKKKRPAKDISASSPPPSSSGGREKRARKSLDVYVPEDFTKVDHTVKIVRGRGVALGDIDAVKDSIEQYCQSKPHIAEMAHKFVFGGSRKPIKNDISRNLLAFSGYLPPKPDDIAEKELEAMDKKLEAKMGERAFKLKVQDIKALCDFFALDRSGIPNKDDLIDCLLDFLSEPSDDNVKDVSPSKTKTSSSATKKGNSAMRQKRSSKGDSKAAMKKAKMKRTKTSKKDESSDESEEEDESGNESESGKDDGGDDGIDLQNVKKGEMPDDKTLRKWVKCFVQCYDLDSASVKIAMEIAGDKFGVDLAEKKDLLKKMLTDAMS